MAGQVVIRRSPLFIDNMNSLTKEYGQRIPNALMQFIKQKMENPLAPFGASDKPNPSSTPMAQLVPKIRHAHLTHDISVFYTISGSNPIEIKLFAVLSHDQAGIGQPVNMKRQKGIGKQMANQTFN